MKSYTLKIGQRIFDDVDGRFGTVLLIGNKDEDCLITDENCDVVVLYRPDDSDGECETTAEDITPLAQKKFNVTFQPFNELEVEVPENGTQEDILDSVSVLVSNLIGTKLKYYMDVKEVAPKKELPHLYQPMNKTTRDLPCELPSFVCFISKEDCKQWLRDESYRTSDFEIKEFSIQGITGPSIAVKTKGYWQYIRMVYVLFDKKTCALVAVDLLDEDEDIGRDVQAKDACALVGAMKEYGYEVNIDDFDILPEEEFEEKGLTVQGFILDY